MIFRKFLLHIGLFTFSLLCSCQNAEIKITVFSQANQFENAGKEGVFHQAAATIKNYTVVFQSDKVKLPVKIRFAWKNTDQSTLFNKANLPAS
ncbi:hypothetical protein [Flavobacterium sp.]|uniref:hypothetical protein n=1 Tax=Flavobacterium sp. TaxID=239 RepID=UPI00286DAFC9|nr:hypothetical protein [Flavobacterium sp.]